MSLDIVGLCGGVRGRNQGVVPQDRHAVTELLLLVYRGQQSQDGRHAGVELADYVDVKSLAVTLRNNG